MGNMHAHEIVTEMKTVRKMNQSKIKMTCSPDWVPPIKKKKIGIAWCRAVDSLRAIHPS